MNYSQDKVINEKNEKWKVLFNERETFLGVKLTDKEKESWKSGTLEDAKKALELRKELKEIYDNGNFTDKLKEHLDHYLKTWENLEQELNNNGCCDLIIYLEGELKERKNHLITKILKKIKDGYYGEWCIDNINKEI